MKKALVIAGLCLLPVLSVQAQYTGPNAKTTVMTVKELQEKGMDDQLVVLRGRVIEQLDHKYYRFADDTGQIAIKFEHKKWPHGLVFDDKNTVEINGKYDKDWRQSKIKVYSIKVIQ